MKKAKHGEWQIKSENQFKMQKNNKNKQAV